MDKMTDSVGNSKGLSVFVILLLAIVGLMLVWGLVTFVAAQFTDTGTTGNPQVTTTTIKE
jgi:hypothetical protein